MVKGMIIFLLGILILLTSCQKEPDQMAVQLDWIHGVHFAGIYVAIEKGFYGDENISVSLHEGGPLIDVHVLNTFIEEEIDFGVFTTWHIISSRKKEQDLIALMSTFQIPPEVLFSLKQSGIQSPGDMVGKRVGGKARRIGANHGCLHGKRGFERHRLAIGQRNVIVLSIHEEIGPGLKLGEDADVGIDVIGAGAAACDNLGLKALGTEDLFGFGQNVH